MAVAVGLPVAGAVLLVVEILVARSGPNIGGPPLALDGEVGAGRPGPVLRVVWLGDSTAAGVGASTPDGSLPRQVAAGLAGPVELTVLAISGARMSDVIHQQLPKVAPARPDVVFVSVGANDTVHGTSMGRFRHDYRTLLNGLPTGADVVLLGVPDMGAPTRLPQPLRAVAGWRGRALDRVVKGIADDRRRTTYVDIAGPTGPRFRAEPKRYFALDHYHPNDAGYALWTNAVLRDWQP